MLYPFHSVPIFLDARGTSMSVLVGKTVGGYPVERSLGAHGYVELLEARTSAAPLNVRVLREDLRADSELCRQVQKGWETARAVQHAALRVVYSTGLEAGIGVYGLEEPVVGKSLRETVLSGSKIAWRDAIIFAEQLLGSLAALHAANLFHGCVWSGDVLITQDQDLKLSGAGLLTKIERQMLQVVPGPAAGYLAPETLSGSPPTVENDVYGAGACLYFLLSGRDPFPGEDAELIRETALEKRPPPISAMRDDITPEVEEYIGRLMTKDPTQRYGTIAAALADLQNLKSNKPLAPLVGGKPAPPPRPIKGNSGLMQKARSGVQGAVPQGTSAVGMRPAKPLGASTGTLQAIKGQTGKVFGRLETHVKSTIPQSDTERKGDDYYRQGQLPLALSNWKDAFENDVPHAALKIKIELAEREMKREAFTSALDEAKLRLESGDYRAAISRAREALLSAENEQQRHEAMHIETEAGRRALESQKSTQIKLIVTTVVVVVVLILMFVFLKSSSPEHTEEEDPERPAVAKLKGGDQAGRLAVPSTGATIHRPAHWQGDGSTLRYLPPGASEENTVLMKVIKSPPQTDFTKRREELKQGIGLPGATKLSSQDTMTFLDGVFACSEIVFRYTRDGLPYARYYYLIQGPSEVVYQIEFDGPESVLDLAMQAQVREIMRSWSYKKVSP